MSAVAIFANLQIKVGEAVECENANKAEFNVCCWKASAWMTVGLDDVETGTSEPGEVNQRGYFHSNANRIEFTGFAVRRAK
jgi:hypothetical protein